MTQWEYRKLDLNNVSARSSEIDLLDEAGKDGWELVRITANNFAYFKRALEDVAPAPQPRARQTRRKTAAAPASGESPAG